MDLFEFLTESPICKSSAFLKEDKSYNRRGSDYTDVNGLLVLENEKKDQLTIYFDPTYRAGVTVCIEVRNEKYFYSARDRKEYRYKKNEILCKEYNVLFKRLCHVVDENQRVRDMKDLLKKGAAEKVGIILKESHKSLESLYEVSCKEINSIIEMSEEVDGWYGGRIMGGGFGGCSIHLVAYERVNEFTDHIMESYKGKFHIVPEIMKVTFPGGLEQL